MSRNAINILPLHICIIASLNCVGSITNQENLQQNADANICTAKSGKDYCRSVEVKELGDKHTKRMEFAMCLSEILDVEV